MASKAINNVQAVIYARYSSHNQREESIEQQIDECMKFAEANNFEVIDIYSDKAISGKTDRRTSFQRMMRDAERKKFDVVIAYKSNRIARNMLNALQYEAKLEVFGVKTFYAKEEFGDTAAGRFALRTMMNVNQFYSENMAEDIKRGLMDNAAACKANGSVAYGYRRGKDGRYVIDEAEAAIVKEIFAKILADVPLVDIINSLNSRGVKTKSGGKWTHSSFQRMLSNVLYTGVYHYSDVVVDGGVPQIISKEDFAKMQTKLQSKKQPRGRRRGNDYAEYLLTGKLHCGPCGSHMVGLSGTGKHGELHYYYTCQRKRKKHDCKKKNVRRDWLEQKVAELTKQIVLQDEVIEWIAANAVTFQRESLQQSADAILLERQLADAKKAHGNIMKAIEAGIITPSTKGRLIELETEIENLEHSIEATKPHIELIEKERIIYALEKLRDGDIDDKEYQRVLIDSFVKSVTLWEDKIQIDYYYTDTNPLMADIQTADFGKDIGENTGSYKLRIAPPNSTYTNPEVMIYLNFGGFVLVAPI